MKPLPPRSAAIVRRSLPWLLGVAGAVFLFSGARGDDVLPQMPPPHRYDKLAGHSPFSPPTAGPAPAAPASTPPPGPAWSDNLTVTSIMQLGNLYTATVMEKDSSARHLIRSDEEDTETHLMLTGVRWADKSDAIKVTVRKGTLFGELRFDPSAAVGGTGPLPGGPPPGIRPGVPNPAMNFRPPPPVAASIPNPPGGQPPGGIVRGRPVIRANPPAGMPQRPVITTPQVPNRAVQPVKPAAGDDDDDDDN